MKRTSLSPALGVLALICGALGLGALAPETARALTVTDISCDQVGTTLTDCKSVSGANDDSDLVGSLYGYGPGAVTSIGKVDIDGWVFEPASNPLNIVIEFDSGTQRSGDWSADLSAYAPTDDFWLAVKAGRAFTIGKIDLSGSCLTGLASCAGTWTSEVLGADLSHLTFYRAPSLPAIEGQVPLPAALPLLAVALGGLVLVRRRTR